VRNISVLSFADKFPSLILPRLAISAKLALTEKNLLLIEQVFVF